jgi:hypothetical protein
MSSHIISSTEASRSFSTILNKVHYQGEIYVIKLGKEVIAKIIPASPKKPNLKIGTVNELFRNIAHLDEDNRAAFEKEIKSIRSNMKLEDEPWD